MLNELKELIRIFEKRRTNMIVLLKNRSEELSSERQHQLLGAIMEIDVFLRTLKYYHYQNLVEKDARELSPDEAKLIEGTK